MKNIIYILILFFYTSCGSFIEGPREFDWETEWEINSHDLKGLLVDIKTHSDKFKNGNNDFPDEFDYPFDQGFYLKKENDYITVKFYLDRGLLDHYSAFVYTDDPIKINRLESKVKLDGNDHKLENNWYCIND